MVERLRGCGVSVEDDELRGMTKTGTVGRRHLAQWLVDTRRAGSTREAFTRYLGDRGRATVPKLRLPVAEAIGLVRSAGGVTSWAHPRADCTLDDLAGLRDLGLQAVEAHYPAFRPRRVRELRAWAGELGLAVSAGSDCHGPGHPSRAIGACCLSAAELEALEQTRSQRSALASTRSDLSHSEMLFAATSGAAATVGKR